MSEQFKVGDVCIGQNHVNDVKYNGMECTVTGGLKMRMWKKSKKIGIDMLYEIEWATGEICVADGANLRKKQPPRSAKSIMREAILKAQQPAKVPA